MGRTKPQHRKDLRAWRCKNALIIIGLYALLVGLCVLESILIHEKYQTIVGFGLGIVIQFIMNWWISFRMIDKPQKPIRFTPIRSYTTVGWAQPHCSQGFETKT